MVAGCVCAESVVWVGVGVGWREVEVGYGVVVDEAAGEYVVVSGLGYWNGEC